MSTVKIHPSWKEALSFEFGKPYFTGLRDFVRAEYTRKAIYPPATQIFHALDTCPFDKVKVVIVGQDPYHGRGQANGLSFAVHDGVTLPPSLKNIFKEIKDDLNVDALPSGDLSRWAKQGVLLLNAVLTVQAGMPASHKGKGWEEFTDAVIQQLNEQRSSIVYMLWGKYAQEKGRSIDRSKNLVLQSGHPSPYSAHLFHGKHHFSQCNAYLALQGLEPIDWR